MIIDSIAGSPGVLRRSWLLLFVAPVKFAAVMFVVFITLLAPMSLAVAAFILKASPYIVLATASFGLLLAVISSLVVGAVFDAALMGGALDAVNGRAVTVDSLRTWGLARWRRVFGVNAASYTLSALLLLLFAPAVGFYGAHSLTAALAAGFAAAAAASAGFLLLGVALMPLSYMAAFYDMDLQGYFRSSASYVRSNLPESLIICATAALIAQVLYAVESVVTGPPQMIPYVGAAASGMLTILFATLNSAAISALSAVWWTALLRDRPPKSGSAVSPPSP